MSDLFSFVEDQAQKSAKNRKENSRQITPQASTPTAQTLAIHDDQNAPISVSVLTRDIRRLIEQSFGRIAVEGEISNLSMPSSGHCYLKLKDDQALINAVIWRTALSKMTIKPEDGMKVIAYGTLTTYGARSEYQMTIDRITPAGVGDLMQLLEERKAKLTAEGLFDEDRKKPLPFLPASIGIITSPTGAVISDMLHRLEDRCPRPVRLWPTMVQGAGAAEQIAAAIAGFNALPLTEQPDVLIVARGGGSLEDLWAFNEEIVVRAIATSEIPIISGVGHEPDVTLADYVADVRAPTPTAAAELVVPVRDDIITTLNFRRQQMRRAMEQFLQKQKFYIQHLQQKLPTPTHELRQWQQRLDDQQQRLIKAMRQNIQQQKLRVPQQALLTTAIRRQLAQQRTACNHTTQLLHSFAPDAPLKRGYAYVTGADGRVITSAKTTQTAVILHFADGQRNAELHPKGDA